MKLRVPAAMCARKSGKKRNPRMSKREVRARKFPFFPVKIRAYKNRCRTDRRGIEGKQSRKEGLRRRLKKKKPALELKDARDFQLPEGIRADAK